MQNLTAAAKAQQSLILDKLIRTKQWNQFGIELQRLCGIIVIKDEILNNDFITAIKQNKLETFGDYELRASGEAYFFDWKAPELQEKEATNACGETIKVKYRICNTPFDAQVPEDYVDYLTLNFQKQLPIHLSKDTLRKLACGKDTYDALRDLIISKIKSATIKLVRNTVLCALNNVRNYKKVETINYCCDKCDGQSLLSALNTFALELQENTAPYNIASRGYDVPIESMFFLKSYNLDSKLKSILAHAFSDTNININSSFNKTWALPLKAFDAIICSKNFIQLQEVLHETDWCYSATTRSECGIVNYDFRFKLVNFEMGVPIKLQKIDCKLKTAIDTLKQKVQTIEEVFEVSDEEDAKKQVKEFIEKLKPTSPKLELEYTFKNFTAPLKDKEGTISFSIEVVDELKTIKETITGRVYLALKKEEKK